MLTPVSYTLFPMARVAAANCFFTEALRETIKYELGSGAYAARYDTGSKRTVEESFSAARVVTACD